MRHSDAEAEHPALHCIKQLTKPFLKRLTLPTLSASDPIGKLRDDDRAGVAGGLLALEPGDDLAVTAPLRGLA